MLLAYLDHRTLYDSINFAIPKWVGGSRLPADNTAFNTSVSVFLCPDDMVPPGGRTDYAGNGGVGSYWNGFNGVFVDNLIRNPPSIGFAAVRDGASLTAGFSEWVIGQYLERNPRAMVFKTEHFEAPGEFDEFTSACHNLVLSTAEISTWAKSAWWLEGAYGSSLLDHNLVVNDYSCGNGGGSSGAWTAGSRHPGNGANTVFLDGHVQFIKDSIDLMTWRALGTRSGER